MISKVVKHSYCTFFLSQVNVKPSERPQDLYGEVANLVDKKRAADAAKGDKLAIQLEGTLLNSMQHSCSVLISVSFNDCIDLCTVCHCPAVYMSVSIYV